MFFSEAAGLHSGSIIGKDELSYLRTLDLLHPCFRTWELAHHLETQPFELGEDGGEFLHIFTRRRPLALDYHDQLFDAEPVET